MKRAPGDEGPVRTVPQAAEHHGGDEIDRTLQRTALAAAQRDINKITQEAGQGNVPPSPQINYVGRAKRRGEIDGQPDVEQQTQSDSHVRVTGEIKIELD